jgi:hypothetical protein
MVMSATPNDSSVLNSNSKIAADSAEEIYKCSSCGLEFKHHEGAMMHLKETHEHSVKHMRSSFAIDVKAHY